MFRSLKWTGFAVLALLVVVAACVALLNIDLRGAIVRWVSDRTGRELAIKGDFDWKLDWPHALLHAKDVTFANAAWAQDKQMFSADAVDLSVDLPHLLRGSVVFPALQVERPVVIFEKGKDGEANWRFSDSSDASIWIGQVGLDRAQVTYRDAQAETEIVSEVTSRRAAADASPDAGADGIAFKASGRYHGMPFSASGTGGPAIALRDESTPYPLSITATIGKTSIRGDGTVTGLVNQSAADMKLNLRGASLGDLFAVLGMAMPDTHSYELAGRYVRNGKSWRFERFSGHVGASDVAGSLEKGAGGPRPMLQGEIASKALHLVDLAPVIGEDLPSDQASAGSGRKGKIATKRGPRRVLPTIPFNRERWDTLDADVRIRAQTIIRPKAVPLEQFTTRLRLHQSVMTLEPLDFGAAGGHVDGIVRLDAHPQPIEATARLTIRKLRLAKLLPTVPLAQGSSGFVDGHIELAGRGDTVGRMIATSDGKVALYISDGTVSKILMQKMIMHMPEMLVQQLKGDEMVNIRCGVADFNVENGSMKVETLVLDTDIAKVIGSGTIDLSGEALNLTLVGRAKRPSLFALRGPIHLSGELAHPDVAVDTMQAGGRGLAALALGAINPLLSLAAVADPGDATDSNCPAVMKRAQSIESASPQANRARAKPRSS